MVKKFVNISELANILKLKNDKTGKLKTYILRFWEKKFKQIKPNKFSNNRRFYSHSQVKLLKLIIYPFIGARISKVKHQRIVSYNYNTYIWNMRIYIILYVCMYVYYTHSQKICGPITNNNNKK